MRHHKLYTKARLSSKRSHRSSCARHWGWAGTIQPLFMVRALHFHCPLRKGGKGRRDRAGAWASIEGMSFCSPGQFACSNINCYWKCLIWLRGESQRGSVTLCSWREGSGAFAPNLVMLKGNWYWVNNAHSTHHFSLLSMFTHFYMFLFFMHLWHNSCCIMKDL